jgi:CspA family cold shock protein
MATGTVKWFNPRKGFGMIAPIDGSQDVLVHQSAITDDPRTLNEGQLVEFEAVPGKNGPQAQSVRPVS